MRNHDKEKNLWWLLNPRSRKRAELVKKMDIMVLKPIEDEVEEHNPTEEPFKDIGNKKRCNYCGKHYMLLSSLIKHLEKTMALPCQSMYV